jgi:Holliday junction resolvase YEN1
MALVDHGSVAAEVVGKSTTERGTCSRKCARMQILGMVDAVWSEDSDCLMFGCTLWIRDDRVVKEKGIKDLSKENTQKSKKTSRIVKAQSFKDRLQIDREGLVLFAMLVGGDYDTKGLPGCGPSMAMRVIKKGLGQSLCACRSRRDCGAWGVLLTEALYSSGGRVIDVPQRFPDFKTLFKYNSPKVTSDEGLQNNSQLNLDNIRAINELKLLEVTSSRFNKWGREHTSWVGPVLLTRALLNRSSTLPREVVHGIKLVNERVKNTDSGLPARVFERKLSFSPFGVPTLLREDFEGERQGYWSRKAEDPFDPDYRVENRELPIYWLQKVLPPDILDPPRAEPKRKTVKRKQQDETTETSDPFTAAKKHKKTVQASDPPTAAKRQRKTATSSSTTPDTRPKKTPSKQHPKKSPAPIVEKNIELIELSDSDDELRLPQPRSIPKSSVRPVAAQVTDFGSPSSSETGTDMTQLAVVARHAGQRTPSQNNPQQQAKRSSSYEYEERDLQLALRTSLQEHNAASSPRPFAKDYDSTSFAPPQLEGRSIFMPHRPSATSARNMHLTHSNSPPKVPRQAPGLSKSPATNSIDHGSYATRPSPTGSSRFPDFSPGPFHTLPILPAPRQEEPVSSEVAECGAFVPETLTASSH